MGRLSRLALTAAPLLVSVAAAPAAAADLGAGFGINGGATVVSDYRFRGISQTNRRFAVQGTFSVSHSSGFYGTVWGSSIDDYVANGSDTELDLILGYKKTFGSTTIDGGVLYYYYPGSGGIDSDFAEPYLSVSHAFGPVTAKGTVNWAPKQKGLTLDGVTKESGLYLGGDLSYAIPKTPIGLTAHVGHSFNENYITFGEEYTDWSLGATFTKGPLVAGLAYVDTNTTLFGNGRNISKGGVVASLGVAF
ncbi:MAG: TorF family putative porin [Pseudomonadota bacterium]|nr:TorF family putative porin [Pseudomonadota bacterium]